MQVPPLRVSVGMTAVGNKGSFDSGRTMRDLRSGWHGWWSSYFCESNLFGWGWPAGRRRSKRESPGGSGAL